MNFLKCALKRLQINLIANTPADVYVWVPLESLSSIPQWLNATYFPRVVVLPIEKETWRVPCGLIDDAKWAVRDHFEVEYYLMGRWRLTFSLDFAKVMGYKYHLQFDDDAMLNRYFTNIQAVHFWQRDKRTSSALCEMLST